MATRTISNAGGNSNTTGAWAEGAVPTASDDIVATATSGNLTINASLSCRSFNLTGYTGTLAGSSGLVIGHSTSGASNRALLLPTSGYTHSHSGQVQFVSTNATAQTVTTGGKTLTQPVFSGSGGTWTLQDSFTSNTSVTLTNGTLNLNGQTMNATQFIVSANSNTRVLNMGGGTLNLSIGSGFVALSGPSISTNFSVTGAGTINVTGADPSIRLRGLDWSGTSNGITFVLSGSGTATVDHGTSGTSIGTVGNLTRTGTAVKTDQIVFDGNITVGGTLTLTGEGTAGNRLLVRTTTRGTARTLTAATVSVSYADFRDITGAGAGSWNLASITGKSGDAQGNSGITFTTAATQTYAGGGAGNVSDVTKWTSRIPLPQDNVVVASGTGALTNDMPRFGKDIDFTGFAQTLDLGTTEIHGNLTLGTSSTPSGTGTRTLVGRGSQTITTNGRTFTGSFTIDAIGGTYTLADDLTSNRSATGALTLTSGTFDANDKTVLLSGAAATLEGTAGTLVMGNGTWRFTGATARTFWNATGSTITCESSTITMDANTSNAVTFAGGGKTYNILTWGSSYTGTTTISGANTFAQLISITSARTVRLTSSITQTITSVLRLKNSFTLDSTTAGTAATISAASGVTVDVSNGSIKDSTATGGATFNASATTNVSGNTGWTFNAGVILGLASASDSTYALHLEKRRTIGLDNESDSAFAFTRQKKYTIGLATENDSAFAVTRRKIRTIGLASESDSTFPPTTRKFTRIGLASENDNVYMVSVTGQLFATLGLALETDTALDVLLPIKVTLGSPQENDSAGLPALLVLGLATTSNQTFPLDWEKHYSLGLASELGAVFGVTTRKSRLIGLASETDRTFMVHVRLRLGLATELDTALPPRPPIPIGIALERDSLLGAVTLTFRPRYFSPPAIKEDASVFPRGTPGQKDEQYFARRHFSGHLTGKNVYLLVDGSITTRQPTDQDQIRRIYFGGHLEPVTYAEVVALTAAGYGPNIS